MNDLIESGGRFKAVEVRLNFLKTKPTFVCSESWRKSQKYDESQIVDLRIVDHDKWRSAGGAAALGIAGGILTGGLGLIAGAAIGGRRKQTATFVAKFSDSSFVVFTEKRKDHLKVLTRIAIQKEALAANK